MTWRISSYSAANGNCVEVGTDDGPVVMVRNSTRPDAGTLSLASGAFAAFVAACRSGELDDLTA